MSILKGKPMTRQEKKAYDKKRKINSLKSMYFNRYLMVRYFLAMFLFANLYWVIISWGQVVSFVALALLILSLPAAVEMFAMYGKSEPSVKFTTVFYRVQFVACILTVIALLVMPVSAILPVFTDVLESKIFAIAIFGVGVALSFACIVRLSKIDQNADKQYDRIKTIEKNLNLHI